MSSWAHRLEFRCESDVFGVFIVITYVTYENDRVGKIFNFLLHADVRGLRCLCPSQSVQIIEILSHMYEDG